MAEALIIDAVRTPMAATGAPYAGVRPDDLAAHAIAAAVARTGIDPAQVGDVYWGAANQAEEDNRDVARMASLLAGLPVEVPGVTVNRPLRLGARGREPGVASAPARRGRALSGRWLGVDEPGPLGGAEARRGPRARRATLYDTALGWRLINPRIRSATRPRRWARRPRTSPNGTGSRAPIRTRSRCEPPARDRRPRRGAVRRADRRRRGAGGPRDDPGRG